MKEFSLNFISNEELRASILANALEMHEVWHTPKHRLNFSKVKIINDFKLSFPVIIEYSILGKMILPPSFNQTEDEKKNAPVTNITDVNTLSNFEIESVNGYFVDYFKYRVDIEDIFTEACLLAVKYNTSQLKHHLKETDMFDYIPKEMTEGFIRAGIRQAFTMNKN